MSARKAGRASTETNPASLARLAGSRDWWVRYHVAKNTSTSAKTLESLAADGNDMVRAEVASNPHTPTSILRALSNEDRHNIYDALGGNPGTPPDVLRRVVDRHGYCGEAMNMVVTNVGTPDDLLFDIAVRFILKVEGDEIEVGGLRGRLPLKVGRDFSGRGLNPRVLVRLASHESDEVRAFVPTHVQCDGAMLATIAGDPSARVRQAVARAPSASHGVLTALASDDDWQVREAVWANTNAPDALRLQILPTLIGLPEFQRRHPTKTMAQAKTGPTPVLESVVEELFWTSHLRLCPAALVGLTAQYTVERYRLDFALPAKRIGIEIDGLAFHGDQQAFVRDRRRQRELELLGWRILRFAAKEVMADADACVREAATWVTRQG